MFQWPYCIAAVGLRPRRWKSWFVVTIANALLGCNGNQGVSQLCQRRTQQIEFVLGQIAGKGIGKGSNGNCHFIRGSKVRISFFCGSFLIKNKLQIPITNRQKNIMRRVNITLLQLFIQPVQIQPHAFQVILQNAAVHD